MTETIVAAIIAPAVLAAVGLLVRLKVDVSRIDNTVRRELTANGGSSLRDRVVRIEAQLEAIRLEAQIEATRMQRATHDSNNRWDDPTGNPI